MFQEIERGERLGKFGFQIVFGEGVDVFLAGKGGLEIEKVVDVGGVVAGLENKALFRGGAMIAKETARKFGFQVVVVPC